MFNHEDYQRRLAAEMDDIREKPKKGWLPNVDLNYAQFLIGNVKNRLLRVDASVAAASPACTTRMQKDYLSHLANDVRDIAGILYNAAMLISGTVTVADPVKCEAEMRLFAEANTPRNLHNHPAPEVPVESDAAFRIRLFDVCAAQGRAVEVAAHTASGAELDEIADRYGLKRTGT